MWAPMYDSPYPIGFSPIMWKMVEYYNVKILCFLKVLQVLYRGKNKLSQIKIF